MAITAQSFADISPTDYTAAAAQTIGELLGNSAIVSNVQYFGAGRAGYKVGSFSIGEIGGANLISKGPGLLLTTGTFPGDRNTSPSFGQGNSTAGDKDLDAVAKAAFGDAGDTFDAAVVQFDLNNTDPNVNTITFSIVFGSEEFPEYSNSNFVDVAAVFVNGVNQALFNNEPDQPLSVINKNLDIGNFIDNTSAKYDIQYDGFSPVLTVRAKLNPGINTIKIGVADTGDYIYDSGIFLTDFKLSNEGGTGGGTLVVVDVPNGNGTVDASNSPEQFNLGTGAYNLMGAPTELDGDVAVGFGQDDQITFEGVSFTKNNVIVKQGSLIIAADTDKNGTTDTTFTLAGDFKGKDVDVTSSGNNTVVKLAAPSTGNMGVTKSGTPGADSLTGTAFADKLNGLGGDDKIFGLAGDDLLFGGDGKDTIDGGADNDTINGQGDDDNLYGQAGNDTLLGGAGNDSLNGGIGNDALYGDIGNDKMLGGEGDDGLSGGDGDDSLLGEAGKDTLLGGAGNDILQGGDGDDRIDGGIGNDTINGGTGNDVISAGDGADNIVGGIGNDEINAGAGADAAYGGDGDDKIGGYAGNDSLFGNAGNDLIDGGADNDTLFGGTGSDTFRFTTGFGKDRVIDFSTAEDKLSFKQGIFADYADFLNHAQQTGAAVTVTADSGDSVVLNSVSLSSFSAANFEVFA